MSLIHQALKKIEDARSNPAPSEYYFQTTGIKAIRKYALPVVFVISVVTAYLLFVPVKKTETRQPAAAAAKTQAAPGTPAPAPPVDYNSKGMDEFRAGRFSEAEASFKKALEAEPLKARIHNNMGLTLMKLGKNEGAEAAFKKALELEPGHLEALNNYACLLAQTGRLKRAIPLFEKAIRTDAAYADARLNLAIALEKKGDLQGAFENYSEFLELNGADNDSPLVRKRLMALRSELILKHSGGR